MPILLKASALLSGFDALAALAIGVRYVRRDDLMPYQLKALDRGNFDLDPKLRVLCLAMLRVIGGGFLAFGCAGLSLAVCLWQGTQLAGFGLAASAAALLLPSYLAASSVAKLAPRTGAPTRLALVAAGVAGLAFVGFLAA